MYSLRKSQGKKEAYKTGEGIISHFYATLLEEHSRERYSCNDSHSLRETVNHSRLVDLHPPAVFTHLIHWGFPCHHFCVFIPFDPHCIRLLHCHKHNLVKSSQTLISSQAISFSINILHGLLARLHLRVFGLRVRFSLLHPLLHGQVTLQKR